MAKPVDKHYYGNSGSNPSLLSVCVCVCVCSALPLCCSNTDEELNSIADRMQPLEKSLWCTGHDVAPQSARAGTEKERERAERDA